ncbi:MAG: DNRLRE domain-containing protein [Chitinophagaceae bacterium]|nr:DNRLRE domain-containing protein [Chitinophagaceae bacterium]
MKKIFTMISCLLVGYTSVAQTLIRLKPGPVKGEDAKISISYGCIPAGATEPNEVRNFGDDPELDYMAWTLAALSCGDVIERALIRFVAMDTLPPDKCATLVKAELNLFGVPSSESWGTNYFPGSPYPQANPGWVERVTGDWDEHTLRWNTQPSVTGVNRVAIPYTTARWGWNTSLDVTLLVQDILASGVNNGFRLRLQNENLYRAVLLASSDHSNAALWPELVLYFDSMSVQATRDTTVCIHSKLMLHASGADTFLWTPATGLSNPYTANPELTADSNQTYIVQGRNKRGCVVSDTVNIAVRQAHISAGPDTLLCPDVSLRLFASGANQYSWTPDTGLDGADTDRPVLRYRKPLSYIVRGTDRYGCIAYDTVKIGDAPAPDIKASAEKYAACRGDRIQLHALGAARYSWQPASGLNKPDVPDPFLYFSEPVSYIVRGTDPHGCFSFDTLTLAAAPVPDIQASADRYIACKGDTIRLSTNGGVRYSWQTAKGLDDTKPANPILIVDGNRLYVVTGWNAEGCSAGDTLEIKEYPAAHTSIYTTSNTVSCREQQVLLEGSGLVSYTWSPELYCEHPQAASTIVSPPATMVFTLTGVNEYGCHGWDSITVFYDNSAIVRIPNSFTPNGDGRNDRIRPYVVCDFRLKEFAVYSRWGQQLFATTDITIPWDGTVNGQPQELGTYFYLISGYDGNEAPVLLKGEINLLR